MIKLELDLKAISRLKDRVLNNGNKYDLITPIIESYDDDYDSVTFVHMPNGAVEKVLIVPAGTYFFEKTMLDQIENQNIWYIVFKVRNDVRFGYYFSYGGEGDQFYDTNNKNFSEIPIALTQTKRKRSDLALSHAPEYMIYNKRAKIQKGKIYNHTIKSHCLNEDRTFSIYMPYDYSSTEEGLPYVLMTDGETHLDLLSAGEVLDYLIEVKEIPEMVGIFIDSTRNRNRELSCSKAFEQFIISELMPWVREHYNLSIDPQKGIISGYSLGGLTATYVGFNNPDVFSKVLSQSGSFWYAPENYKPKSDSNWMIEFIECIKMNPVKMYMAIGILEPEKDIIKVNETLYKRLKNLNCDVELEYFNSAHDYLYWGEYLGRGLIHLTRNIK